VAEGIVGCGGWTEVQAKYVRTFDAIELQTTFYHPPGDRVPIVHEPADFRMVTQLMEGLKLKDLDMGDAKYNGPHTCSRCGRLSRWEGTLTRPAVDNNGTERSLRSFAVGRNYARATIMCSPPLRAAA
jgi:hypothetical protein